LISDMSMLNKLSQALVVSCQPLRYSPMDSIDIVVAMAKTAEISGASAVRIEGVENVTAVRQALNIPIIGIVKRVSPDTPVVITPELSDVSDLVAAGADIIALDATARNRPVAVETLIRSILVATNRIFHCYNNLQSLHRMLKASPWPKAGLTRQN